MKIPVCNRLEVPTHLAGTEVTIAPGEWVEIEYEDALRYQNAKDLEIDWARAVALLPSEEDGRRLVGLLSPLEPVDGYGLVGIHAIRGLEARSFSVRHAPVMSAYASMIDPFYPDVADMLRRQTSLARIGLYHTQPPQYHRMGAGLKIAWTMWESTRLPGDWVQILNRDFRAVIVPTRGQRSLFLDSGVTVPVHVIGDGLDLSAYSYVDRPEREPFTFITWGRMTARKCPLETIGCFQQAFPTEKDVRLIVKTRDGCLGAGRIQIKISDPRVSVVDENWTTERLVRFCHEADAAVFLSHGEGFGQPACQAMATGLPVILSDHSGQSDFADSHHSYPVRLHPKTPHVTSLLGNDYNRKDEFLWWENDYDHAIEQMRRVYARRDEAREKGRRASAWVRRHYSIDQMCDSLAELLRSMD